MLQRFSQSHVQTASSKTKLQALVQHYKHSHTRTLRLRMKGTGKGYAHAWDTIDQQAKHQKRNQAIPEISATQKSNGQNCSR